MKIKNLICLVAGALLSLPSCAQKNNSEMNQEQEDQNSKVLVTYFSATGNTRKAANDLAGVLGADVYEIKPEKEYSAADLDWTDTTSRCYYEMHNLEHRPVLAGNVENLADYDTVFVGFPVWWYIAPTVINTFIENNNLEGKAVVCFATSGGSPIEPCVSALKAQYPSINWAGGKLLNRLSTEDLEDWKAELGL
ncbi:MAG: NAD(P)H-dependent oxidoreductase [Muribaculaceae bacterium]|nr:NAD(P)H-dependent oxidoreductase [Muribaculaceae bacterium]